MSSELWLHSSALLRVLAEQRQRGASIWKRRSVTCMAATALSVLLLVAGVVAMLVLHVLIVVWALRRGVFLRGASRRDEERAAAAAGMSAEELGELPCHERKDGAGAGECAVCLEAFQTGDRCRVLPGCDHGFHAPCVDSWLRKSRVCPICRSVVVVGRGKAAGTVAGEDATSEVVAERQAGAER